MKKTKIIYAILFFMIMNIIVPQGLIGTRQAYACCQTVSNIKVLEIIPDYEDEYQLNSYNRHELINGGKIELTKMTLNQFISMRDDINGKYDIVYFSAGHYGYTNTDSYTSARYNDITDLRAKTIKDMIESGQCVIINEDAFEDKASKMYSNFNKYNETDYPNYMVWRKDEDLSWDWVWEWDWIWHWNWHWRKHWSCNSSSNSDHPQLNDLKSLYSDSKKRLNVTILGYPNKEYSSGNKVTISFKVKTANIDASGYTANLYIDTNRDGLYKDDEKKVYKSHQSFDTINNLEYVLPYMYTAPLYYKLEICEEDKDKSATRIKYIEEGSFKYKGKPISTKVLQISPGTNRALDLNEQFKKVHVDGHQLGKSDDYDITVENIVTDSFQNAFKNDSDPNYGKYHNLGANYDMLVFGFADMYKNGDITNNDAMKAILDYNKTGQGMMLTHDTIWYVNSTDKSFPINISRYFVRDAGQSYTNKDLYKGITYNNSDDKHKKDNNDKKHDNGDDKDKENNDGNNYENYGDIYTYDNPPEEIGQDTSYMRFSYYRPIEDIPEGNRGNSFTSADKIKMVNPGVITDYPYKLGSSIYVGTTHDMYYTLNLEDEDVIPWYNLDVSGSYEDSTNSEYYYYTYSTKNLTFSGTGHDPEEIIHKKDELKLFVNTVIKGFLAANHKPEIVVNSPEYHPEKDPGVYEEISGSDENIKVSFIPYDYDLTDADNINTSIFVQNPDGEGYILASSYDNLRSGDTVIKSFKNPYKGSNVSDRIVNIKFVITDSNGASAEQIIPVKFVNKNVLPKPSLDYSTYQGTHDPVISGFGGTADDKEGYIISAWITDSNNKKYGPIQGQTDSDGRFTLHFGNLPDTLDFSKPYQVSVQQFPKTGTGDVGSDIASGSLYIDTAAPVISNIKANDAKLSNNAVLVNPVNKISFTVTDNDPGIESQNKEVALYRLDSTTGQYIKLLGQVVKNGLNEYAPNPSLDVGNYKMTIEAEDRAGNISELVDYKFSVVDNSVLPKPVLNYSAIQNTSSPTIGGTAGRNNDKSGYIVNAWIYDSNGNCIGTGSATTDSQGKFSIVFKDISNLADLSKPYEVRVVQLPKADGYGQESEVALGDLCIDTQIPVISDLKIDDKAYTDNMTTVKSKPSISFNIVDNDKDIVLQDIKAVVQKPDGTQIISDLVRNSDGSYSISLQNELALGDYVIKIQAKDRAGNLSQQGAFKFKVIDNFSKVFQFEFASVRGQSTIALNDSTVAVNITVSVKDIKDPTFNNISDIKIPLCFESTDQSNFEIFSENGIENYIKVIKPSDSDLSSISLYPDNMVNGIVKVPDLLKDIIGNLIGNIPGSKTINIDPHKKEPIYISLPGSISRTDSEKTYSFLVKCKTDSTTMDKLNIWISNQYPILYKLNSKEDIKLILDNSYPIEIPVIKTYLR